MQSEETDRVIIDRKRKAIMKYAIIAAGNGSRLAKEGINVPKPLIEINGESLIDRLIRIFRENDATEILIVCNEEMPEVSRHLTAVQRDGLYGQTVPVRFIVQSTPSSMHSFHVLRGLLGNEPFVLTTVDTVFREDEFGDYVRAFSKAVALGKHALMGVTDYIDDEKPLYVGTTEIASAHQPLPNLSVTGFYDTPNPPCQYISAGIYGLTAPCLDTLQRCIDRDESRMRNFQRALLTDGLCVSAYPFSKVIDIDHVDDIEKGEKLSRQDKPQSAFHIRQMKKYLSSHQAVALLRSPAFSPHSEVNDAAILHAVADPLNIPVVSEDNFKFISDNQYGLILSMGRRPETLKWLKEQTRQGAHVLNSPSGVGLCNNRSMLNVLMKIHDIPHPKTTGSYGYWLKQYNTEAQANENVRYFATHKNLKTALQDLNERGISSRIVQAHIPGDLIKFYGIRGTGFFRYFYPGDDGISKFGYEVHNGKPHHYSFSKEELQEIAERLSGFTKVAIYGGDVIIRRGGAPVIIDFNDWPSFSRCKDEAAEAIIKLMFERVDK